MARRKDLAGIAALAGLGMLMANKGKKGVDEDSRKRQIAADKASNDDVQSMEDDSGMTQRKPQTSVQNVRCAIPTLESLVKPVHL
jgi:hypothetical protein